MTTLVTGVIVAVASLVGDAAETYDLTNIGTLFAFAVWYNLLLAVSSRALQ